MAKAKKLPSGTWRVQLFDYKDVEGKSHYKSFSAPTKSEAEFKALQYERDKKLRNKTEYKVETVSEALARYIRIREDKRSPSTILGYEKMSNRLPLWLTNKRLNDLTVDDMQTYIDEYSKKRGAKSVKNMYGFVKSALKESGLEIKNVVLPEADEHVYYDFTDDEILKLINYAREIYDKDLEIAIMLGAFCTMRRGEIAALTSDDIDYKAGVAHIHKSRIRNRNGIYIDKQSAKTKGSNRYEPLPPFLLDLLPRQGRIISCTPHALTLKMQRAIEKLGFYKDIEVQDNDGNIKIKRISPTLHSTRHYSASVMHALGVPDEYIMARGGWETDHCMQRVYRSTMSDYEKMQNEKINKHFQKLVESQ